MTGTNIIMACSGIQTIIWTQRPLPIDHIQSTIRTMPMLTTQVVVGPGGQHCYTTGLLYHYLMTGNEAFQESSIAAYRLDYLRL